MTLTDTARRIRPAEREKDAERYVDLLGVIDRETTFPLWEPGERPVTPDGLRDVLRRADPAQRLTLVAEDEGGLVGFLVGLRGTQRRTRHRADFTMAVRRAT